MEELEAVLDASRKVAYEQNKFLAALKGIRLDEPAVAEDRVQAIKDRVAAKEAGLTEEEFDLQQGGLGYEIEEE